jgi:hypothetical protein
VIALGPIVASVLATTAAAHWLPRPHRAAGSVLWWVGMLVLATVVATVLASDTQAGATSPAAHLDVGIS